MREDIRTLKVYGGNFVPEAVFNFFGNDTQVNKRTPCCLLYGRNGSGKSTIARGFRKIAGEEEESINNAILCNENGNEVSLGEEEKSKIHVFDQKFIDDNIRFEEDGLDTIVMVGSQVELDKRIKQLEHDISSKEKELDGQKITLEEYNDARNPQAPKYYENKMIEALKGDDNWAGRNKLIKGTRINTSVSNESYKEFIGLKPEKTRDELIVAFKDKYKELESARNGDQRIEFRVITNVDEINVDRINELLLQKIEEPELSPRDKFLIDISKKRSMDFVNDIKTTFSNSDVERCPFCARPINEDEREDIIKGIEKILSKLVEEHQKTLDFLRPKNVVINLEPVKRFSEATAKSIRVLEQYNDYIDRINKQISVKIGNPYEPISDVVSKSELDALRQEVIENLTALKKEKNAYNDRISDTKQIISELTCINSEIAYWDIHEYYEVHQEQVEKKDSFTSKYDTLKEEHESLIHKKEELEAQKKNVNIAVDFINRSLRYIFFSKDRLKLEYVNGLYQLKVNGFTVKPNQISTGETNAIALSYFFSKVVEGKKAEGFYKDSYLVVIDDPITSFDAENKVGMLSYLKSQVHRFVLGNLETKFLIMTHDMMTFESIYHITEELAKIVKKEYSNTGLQLKNKYYLLYSSKLEEYDARNNNEYSKLYNLVYLFLKDESVEDSIPIGNIMRQLLEAFSTFQFKVGIEELSTKEGIIELLPEDDYKRYFKNYMYRLVLNSGSHKENEAKFNLDMDFQNLYTLEEKKRTAKSILCFLYLLNKEHVLAHLSFKGNGYEAKNKQAKLDLEAWCKEIKKIAE